MHATLLTRHTFAADIEYCRLKGYTILGLGFGITFWNVPDDVLSLKDFKVQDLDLVSSVQKMVALKDVIEMMECRMAPDISKVFGTVYAGIHQFGQKDGVEVQKKSYNGKHITLHPGE